MVPGDVAAKVRLYPYPQLGANHDFYLQVLTLINILSLGLDLKALYSQPDPEIKDQGKKLSVHLSHLE